MPESNPLDVMLAHNLWATRALLETCAKLSEEQFHRRFEIGPGSLHDTTAHIIGALIGWGDFLQGKPDGKGLGDGVKRTPRELLALLDKHAAEFAAVAHSRPVDEIITGARGTFPRGGVITHVATHGMHHRAQCLNMLRQLGVNPLPPCTVRQWMVAMQPA